jgi:hypothetical protein
MASDQSKVIAAGPMPDSALGATVALRPTRPEDLAAVIGEPLPYRIKAITALAGDMVLGVGGLAFPPKGPVIAFVHQAPEAKRYKVSFHRAGLMAMKMAREMKLPRVVATTDADYQAGVRWLKRLGFKEAPAPCQDMPGKIIFVWTCDHAVPALN